MVHTFQRSSNGRVISRGRITRQVELEVLAASQSGFTVRWSFLDAQAEGALTELPVEEWLLLLKDVRVEVEADRAGDFNGIRNWQEAEIQVRESGERLMEANPAVDAGERAEYRRLLQAMFARKESAEAFFGKEIRLCTFMLGWWIAPGKPEHYSDYLANPFGGEQLPTRATLLLRAYDAGSGRADLRWWQNLSVAEAGRILRDSVDAEAKRTGQPAASPAEIPRLHIGDRADIVLDNKTGWLRTLHNDRTVTLRQGKDEMRELRTRRITSRTP
ncbi:MAG: hypothetical protein ACO1SX_24165 [Actinomycetota bacterium]